MNWIVVLVAGLIGVVCGARLTIGGAALVFAGVLLIVSGLGLATGVHTGGAVLHVLLSAVSLQFGYLVGAFVLARQILPGWSLRRRLNKRHKGDRTP